MHLYNLCISRKFCFWLTGTEILSDAVAYQSEQGKVQIRNNWHICINIYWHVQYTLILTLSGYLLSNQSTAVYPTSTAAPTAAALAASGSATGTMTVGTWATSRSAVSSCPRHFCRYCSWKRKKKCFNSRVKLYVPLHPQPRRPVTQPTSSAAWLQGRASRWPSNVTTRMTAETTVMRSIVVR